MFGSIADGAKGLWNKVTGGNKSNSEAASRATLTNEDAKNQFTNNITEVTDKDGNIVRKYTNVNGIHMEFSLSISPSSVSDSSLAKMSGGLIKNIANAAHENGISGLYINSGHRGEGTSHAGNAIDIGGIYPTRPSDGNWSYPSNTDFVRSRNSETDSWAPASKTSEMEGFLNSLRTKPNTAIVWEPWNMSEHRNGQEVYNRPNKINDSSISNDDLKKNNFQDWNHRHHIHYGITPE
ncbi:hypothetical protein [Leptospira noguchii]|uniref:Uncharacterized protein n=1 Tax=Leptospira noguchii str. 2007001578 TaxID=1049974 RepID=A0ABN0J1F5_9LEPT|nr:hypothetical protein [Leptospira noguchii]EMN00716.1 hypothetical protein LEP1GSC035_0375 [Leptospira noguchii str. 2007001578]